MRLQQLLYMKNTCSHHKNFKVIKCGLFVNKEFPFLHATPDFLTYCDCCGEGCGEMKSPISIENLDFENYAKKDCLCLELVHGRFRLKRSHIYYDLVQQQLFTCNKPHNDFVVCAFDSNGNASFVIERIHPDNAHWQTALQKLTTFWRICILPEILGRWYTRKCHLEVVLPADGGICYCRSTDQENTVTCSNNDCAYAKFHSSCLAITGPLPKTWYCPHCYQSSRKQGPSHDQCRRRGKKEIQQVTMRLWLWLRYVSVSRNRSRQTGCYSATM